MKSEGDHEKRGLSACGCQSRYLDTFSKEVDTRSADLQLKGAVEMLSWRGEHPWSKAKMQVVAVAWSQRWAADAAAVGQAMGAAEQRMKQQGGVPSAPSAAGGTAGGAPSAAPVKSGAGVSTSDF